MVEVWRTLDGSRLTEIANRPDVRPWLGDGDHPLDLRPHVANPANYVFESQNGGFLLLPILAGVYEAHTLYPPGGRGAEHMAAARAVIRRMFAETDCLDLVSKCPDDNPGAAMAANLLGFRERFHRADAWAPGVGVSYRGFNIDDWTARDRECRRAGQLFHELLETAKAASGCELPTHPEDPAHDRAVGAALLMIVGGQPGKGIGLYNRWAAFAGYAPAAQLGPALFDVGDGVVELRDGAPRVVLTR